MIIYILECERGKYYVGKSNNIDNRLYTHKFYYGSAWTSKYRPVKVLKMLEDCDIYDEDKYTIMMMDKYGIDNVRGGSFTRISLSNNENNFIYKMIRGANDKCFNCGSYNHFIHKCDSEPLNVHLKILYDKIIRLCKEVDGSQININIYVKILKLVDNIIFNNITVKDIIRFCDNMKENVNYDIITNRIINELNQIYNKCS